MAECTRRRTRLSLCLLLCTLPVLTLSSAHTTWRADCGDGMQDTVTCTVELTDCHKNHGLTDSVYTGEMQTEQHLRITPIFTKLFADDRAEGELRWYPKVNISWRNDQSVQKSSYFIWMVFLDKDSVTDNTSCEECVNLTIVNHNPTPTTTIQRVALHSLDIFHCHPERRPKFLFIRVREQGRMKGGYVGETSMSFPNDIKSSRGLPTCYRRIVPNNKINCNFNPCTWTTPVVVSNSSCNNEVKVEFELAPGDLIDVYILMLVKYYQVVFITRNFTARVADVIGHVTFKDVHPGIYYLSLRFSLKRKRHSQINNDDCIIPVRTGYVTIADGSNCTTLAVSNTEAAVPARQYFETLLVLIIVITVLVAMAMVGIFLYWRRKNCLKNRFLPVHSCQNRPPVEPAEKEIAVYRRRILLVYCMDNESHRHVVRCFAELLCDEGECDVIFEEWHVPDIQKYGMQHWMGIQYETAYKIIIIGSEGATRFLKAKRLEHCYPLLETAFPLSDAFSSAVRIISEAKSPSSPESKALAVTFRYTTTTQGDPDMHRELAGNDISFYLTRDMGRLLLAIHDTKKYTHENSIREWKTDIMQSRAGRRLHDALEAAREFHECNPNWFVSTYGVPEPYTRQKSCSSRTPSDGLLGELIPYQLRNLTGPEDCQFILELDGPQLVPPADELESSTECLPIVLGPDRTEDSGSSSHSAGSTGKCLDSGIGMSLPMQMRRWSLNGTLSVDHHTGAYDRYPEEYATRLLHCDDGRELLCHSPPSSEPYLSQPSSLSSSVHVSDFDMDYDVVQGQD